VNNDGLGERRLIDKPRDFVYRQVFLTAQNFIRIEAASGIVLLAATIAALVWANSPWSDSYTDFWHTHVTIDADILLIDLDLQEWVNDALMTFFFFLAGLEIKRELVHGELSSPRRALLPAAAALGGMLVPALIFFAIAGGTDGSDGWGIPMATDIAFAVGILALLARRIPASIRVFLLALAIADDIGAILVIAVFYTSDISFLALGFAALTLAVIVICNRSGMRNVDVYVLLGAILWVTILESGIHATITGVILGLLTPASHYYDPDTFAGDAEDLVRRFREAEELDDERMKESVLHQMEDLAHGTEAPLERLDRALVTWVSFLIVPLFALANAGVYIDSDTMERAIESPLSQGVALGLVLGKPVGIFLFTWLAVQLKLCDKPTGASWGQILGVGMIAGIGFTISLLITGLAFENELLIDEAKLGVLAGSTVAGLAGLVFLFLSSSPARRSEVTSD
jgi:NhaA family Na+:H+ antiporter